MTDTAPDLDLLARELPGTGRLLADLDDAVTAPRSGGAVRIGSSGHKERPVPINLAAIDAANGLRRSLQVAAHRIAADEGAELHPSDTVGYLIDVVDHAPATVEPYADRLLAAYRRAHRVLDGAPEPEHALTPEQQRKAAARFVTAAEAESITAATGERVKAGRIRLWAFRGKLAGHEIEGRTVYRLADVLEVAGQTAA